LRDGADRKRRGGGGSAVLVPPPPALWAMRLGEAAGAGLAEGGGSKSSGPASVRALEQRSWARPLGRGLQEGAEPSSPGPASARSLGHRSWAGLAEGGVAISHGPAFARPLEQCGWARPVGWGRWRGAGPRGPRQPAHSAGACSCRRPCLQGLTVSSPETRARPPCPPRTRLTGWAWPGRTMAVSEGTLQRSSRSPRRGFLGGSAGRVGPGGCGPRGPGRAGRAGWRWRGAAPASPRAPGRPVGPGRLPALARAAAGAPPRASRRQRDRDWGDGRGEVAGGRAGRVPGTGTGTGTGTGPRLCSTRWEGAACRAHPGSRPARPQASCQVRSRAGHSCFLQTAFPRPDFKIKKKKKKSPTKKASKTSDFLIFCGHLWDVSEPWVGWLLLAIVGSFRVPILFCVLGIILFFLNKKNYQQLYVKYCATFVKIGMSKTSPAFKELLIRETDRCTS
jgi:hypothetical protein